MKSLAATIIAASALMIGLLPTSPARAASAERASFGKLPDGRAVEAVTLANDHGMRVRVLSYGALIQSLMVPDAKGHTDDIVLGYDSLNGYLTRPNYFGVSVGRYANRIGGASFVLDGKRYQLARNDGPNSLHGGAKGFGERLWSVTATKAGTAASVTLTYHSADGEEGYPGALDATVTYTLAEDNSLSIEYRATTDKPTIVNLTNHSYFNLGGIHSRHSVLGEWLTIPATRYTPVDTTLIPTGELRDVKASPFDFTAPAQIGARIRDGHDAQLVLARGYDHNWVIGAAPSAETRLMARLEDRESGRVMALESNQPGLQFYSGNFLDGTYVGKDGVIYRQADALCLEPQVFPDTPNQPAFGSARLDPGQTYRNLIIYRFGIRP